MAARTAPVCEFLAAIALAVAVAIALAAQAAPDRSPRLAFEVATIKRNVSLNEGGGGGLGRGGRFRLVNVSVRPMILMAYRNGPPLMLSQVTGGPGWLDSEKYDITAKVSDDFTSRPQAEQVAAQPLLLQSLLEDRFKLNVHRETRQLPIYSLVRARKDGSPGPQLRPSIVDCKIEPDKCRLDFAPGRFYGGAMRMDSLIGFLSSNVQRVVVDRTGLKGTFELTLEFTPDRTALPLSADATPPPADKPSILTALQDQLGLKLESGRGPVDVVVIDHVERPTED
jgi:bla regulator protein blaR1